MWKREKIDPYVTPDKRINSMVSGCKCKTETVLRFSRTRRKYSSRVMVGKGFPVRIQSPETIKEKTDKFGYMK